MKLSAKSRYAARILIELAKEGIGQPMSASTLSQNTGVSVQFVEQILKPLKQKGLTKSIRGAAGGHKLARPAESITLGEVVRLMEGGIQLTVCCSEKNQQICARSKTCPTKQAWKHVSLALEKELDAISIASLIETSPPCHLVEKKRVAKSAAVVKPAAKSTTAESPKESTKTVKGKAAAAEKEQQVITIRSTTRRVKGLLRPKKK